MKINVLLKFKSQFSPCFSLLIFVDLLIELYIFLLRTKFISLLTYLG